MKDAEPGDTGVTIDFGLSPSNLNEETREAWPYNFGLIYSVTLTRDGLETSMVVRNEGQQAWDFQVLMHTYLKVKVRQD
jgi:glucose-6-phosphate 1-epimerase